MKFAKLLINNILIPVFTVLFFLVGVLAAFISALIEYSVFEQLYSSAFLKLLPASVVAFAMILAFEYTKIYLHYFLNRLKAACNKEHLPKYRRLNIIKRALVVISVACSIIYSVSALYLASYDKSEVDKQITEINTQLSESIEQIKLEEDENYNNRIQPYYEKVQAAAESTYENIRTQFELERDEAIKSRTAEATDKANDTIAVLSDTTSSTVAAQYDNPILSQFLTVLAITFTGSATYSRLAYLILSIVIGLSVSIILEIVISFAFSLLANANEIQFSDPINVDNKFQRWSEQLILAFIKTFFALTIYVIIVGLANNSSSVPEDQFWIALLAYWLAICMAKFFSSKNPKRNSECDSIKMDFYEATKESVIQGILSFAGFMLLGFAFGKDAITLDISTIAIGFGATLSSLLGKLPEKILQAIPPIK